MYLDIITSEAEHFVDVFPVHLEVEVLPLVHLHLRGFVPVTFRVEESVQHLLKNGERYGWFLGYPGSARVL